MESYSFFYKILIERKTKIIDFSAFKQQLSLMKKELDSIEDKISIFVKCKKQKELEIQKIRDQKNLLEKGKKEIEKQILVLVMKFKILKDLKRKL